MERLFPKLSQFSWSYNPPPFFWRIGVSLKQFGGGGEVPDQSNYSSVFFGYLFVLLRTCTFMTQAARDASQPAQKINCKTSDDILHWSSCSNCCMSWVQEAANTRGDAYLRFLSSCDIRNFRNERIFIVFSNSYLRLNRLALSVWEND